MRKIKQIKSRVLATALTFTMVFSLTPSIVYTPTTVKAAVTKASTSTAVSELKNIFTTIDLMDATVSELENAMEEGILTAKQLVQMYLDRINAYDKSQNLNSVITINDKALAQAEELDKERATGKIKGSLHGIPIIVKDNYDVEGMPTSAGCLALKNSIAPDDSYAVKKLKEAGAIIIAKANMSEFASSGRNSRSTLGGTVHNPYDTTRTPAGSSGGTAVAVTSNFAAVGLGTDTGSSVRAPSTLNNLFGIRVSLGLTSRDGIVPLSLDNDIAGVLSRSTEDLATVLQVISGTDANDSWTAESDNMKPSTGYESYLNSDGLKGKKIGYLQDSFGYYYDNNGNEVANPVPLASNMTSIVETAKKNLEAAGAELVDLTDILPNSLITSLRANTGVGSVFEWDINTYFASLGENAPIKTVYQLINNFTYGVDYTNISVRNPSESLADMTDPRSLDSYKTAIANRLNFRNTVSKLLEDNGIAAVMYIPYTQPANTEEDSQNASYANGASYTSHFGPTAGLPDMAVPMGLADTSEELGYTKEMPMGMNIFTSYGNDEELVEIAYAYEQQAGYTNIRKQPYTTPALEDKNLDAYAEKLLDEVDSINYSNYTVYPQGKVNTMLSKYQTLNSVDKSDVYSTYDATYDLAVAYDSVMTKLNANKVTPTTPTVTSTAKVSLTKAKFTKVTRSKSSKKITIKIKKQSSAIGYQIKYSTKKKFTSGYTFDKLTTKTSTTLKGLSKKKKYYVKVRAYAVSNGKLTYGTWSKVKTVKKK